jgi:hypothetical protein
MHEHVKKRSLQQGRELVGFTRGGGTGKHENPAADDGAYTERRKTEPSESLFEPVFRLFGVGNELIDAFATKKLWVQSPPSA